MAPITWRNINVQGQGAANALMNAGANRISEGITQLSDMANDYGNSLQTQSDKRKKENTDLLLNTIGEFNTMEDFNQAVQSGDYSVATLKERFGKEVDISAVRNALMNQDNTIMQQETDEYNYEQTIKARSDKPILNDQLTQIHNMSDVAGIDALLDNIDNLGLSNEGKLSLVQQANQRKTSLLDTAYKQVQQGRDAWRFGREQLEASLSDRDRWVRENTAEAVTISNANIKTAETAISKLDEKYPVPEGFHDQMGMGTSAESLSNWVGGMDSADIDTGAILGDVQKHLSKGTYPIKDASGKVVGEHTLDTLPKWVMDEALKEVKIDAERWSLGRVDINNKELKRIKEAVESNLQRYYEYETNYKAKVAAQKLNNSVIYQEQLKQIEITKTAREQYDREHKPNKP